MADFLQPRLHVCQLAILFLSRSVWIVIIVAKKKKVYHPHQLDVILPESDASLIEALEKLETKYGKGRTKLSDVVNNANAFVNVHNAERHDESYILLNLLSDTFFTVPCSC